jgi:hypothetical protein
MKLGLLLLVALVLWGGAQAKCGDDLTSSVSANLGSVKNLWINSIHPYVIEMGASLEFY